MPIVKSPRPGQLIHVSLFGQETLGIYIEPPGERGGLIVYYAPQLLPQGQESSEKQPYPGVMPYWPENVLRILDVVVAPARLGGAAALDWEIPADEGLGTPAFAVTWSRGRQEGPNIPGDAVWSLRLLP